MIQKIMVFCLVFAVGYSIQAQSSSTENVWKTLGKVSYKKQYDELLGFKVDIPIFHEDIKSMEGQKIRVKGYVIPVEGYAEHSDFIFSAFPYNMCFFCGGAGPETVMEVSAEKGVSFTAEQIVIEGTLRLNDEDINRLMFQLEDAQLIE